MAARTGKTNSTSEAARPSRTGPTRERSSEPTRQWKRSEIQHHESCGADEPRGPALARHIRRRQPHGEHDQRRQTTDRVKKRLASRDGDRQKPRIDDQQEPEEQRRVGAVGRDGGEIAREDQRNAGRQHRRPLEASRRPVALCVTSRAGYRQSDGRCQRKHEKDAHRDREAALLEEAGDPYELVERGEAERQPCQHGPDLPIRHPRETHIEEQQVREERDRTILPGGHQRRRREAAQQPEHRDEERLAPDREQHRERCHNREKDERRGRGDEIPQRVRGEERGEQNRDRRAVQGVGSRGYSRAAFNSQSTRSTTDTRTPIATRTGGWSHP